MDMSKEQSPLIWTDLNPQAGRVGRQSHGSLEVFKGTQASKAKAEEGENLHSPLSCTQYELKLGQC